MKKLLTALFAATFVLSACADVKNDLASGQPDETGGSTGSGGETSSGGVIGAGNSSSTGSAAATGGGSSGGSATGGSSTGGLASGGSSTGGAATGGAGTGGAIVITEGDCAGMPTLDAWKVDSSRAMGDEVVIQCTIAQASCAGLPTNVNILFECIASHVPNCEGQSPSGGNGVWKYVKTCSEDAAGTGGDGTGGSI